MNNLIKQSSLHLFDVNISTKIPNHSNSNLIFNIRFISFPSELFNINQTFALKLFFQINIESSSEN
jgi:hypothetical protein